MLDKMPNVNGNNPFLIGEPVSSVDQFFGRSKQTRTILEYVRNGQCISLVGPAGIGKTSLLYHVSDPRIRTRWGLGPQVALFCRLEGKELAGRDQAACLVWFVDQILVQAAAVDAALAARMRKAIEGRSGGHMGLRTLFRVLDGEGMQPVVTLDDFDDLARNAQLEDSFFAALRSLATGCQVSYVVASLKPLYELETMRPEASTLCGICQQMPLSPFSEQESRSMVLGLLEQGQATFPASIVDRILSWGRNEPWRLQLAGYEAFRVWQENGGSLNGSEGAALERRWERAAAPGS